MLDSLAEPKAFQAFIISERAKRGAETADTEVLEGTVSADGLEVDGAVPSENQRPQPREMFEKAEIVECAKAIERCAQASLGMPREDVIAEQLQRRVRDIKFFPELNKPHRRVSRDPLRICTVEVTIDVQDTSRQHPRTAVIGEVAPQPRVPAKDLVYWFLLLGCHVAWLGFAFELEGTEEFVLRRRHRLAIRIGKFNR